MSYADALDFWDDDAFESDFCECGVTLLDGESMCATCRCSPHGRDCPCDECGDYWERVCRELAEAAEKANRALVCACGWTGAFIEHHNSEAYGATPRVGCVVSYREPERAEFWREQDWNVEPKVWLPERSLWVPQSQAAETPSRGRSGQ